MVWDFFESSPQKNIVFDMEELYSYKEKTLQKKSKHGNKIQHNNNKKYTYTDWYQTNQFMRYSLFIDVFGNQCRIMVT